jgi:hypothetical protein
MKELLVKSRIISLVIIITLTVFFSNIYIFRIVGASDTPVNFTGRAELHGYFDNGTKTQPPLTVANNVLPPYNGYDEALPADKVNNVNQFIDLLKNYNNSDDPRKKTGSAFIVQTLLGKKGESGLRTVTGDDWTKLSNSLSAASIKWDARITQNSISCTSSYYQNKDSENDVAFYYCNKNPSSRGSSGSGISITSNNGNTYNLLRWCANPVGNIQPITPEPEPEIIIPPTNSSCRPLTISFSPSTVDYYGKKVPWRVSLINTSSSKKISKGSYSSKTTLDITKDCTTGDTWQVNYSTSSYVYKITRKCNSDGKCSRTIHRKSYSNTVSIASTPCYDYLLTPSVNDNSLGDIVESGAQVDFRISMKNESFTSKYLPNFYSKYKTFTKSRDVNWQVLRIRVGPNDSTDIAPGISNIEPCTYFKSKLKIVSCDQIVSGNSVFSNNINSKVIKGSASPVDIDDVIGDFPAGTKICYAFSVDNFASDSTQWAHSKIDFIHNCIIVMKKPKVQVHGGDLSVGKQFGSVSSLKSSFIQTSQSVKKIGSNNVKFGSWVEYGIFAPGTVVGMSSGSAFAGIDFSSASDKCSYSKLTFTNAGSGTCNGGTSLGAFNPKTPLPDIESSFRTTLATPSIDSGSLDARSGLYRADSNITIGASNISKGRWIVINAPDRTVTINGDIRYTGDTLRKTSDIPQVVIIARDINITQDVTNIDAWLIAKGDLNTCSSVGKTSNLTINVCNKLLTINGPAVANKLYLRRTAGSGTGNSSGDPAEIINLRPDAYLWAYHQALTRGQVHTVYSQELPPRM